MEDFTIHLSPAVPHTLWYRYTAITSGGTFPEFIVVGLVDGEQFVYYDSNIRKMIPKTEWIKKTSNREYWEKETQRMQDQQWHFQDSMAIVMKSFIDTEGVHTLQRMYGCELYDNGTTRGHDQFGYDGEDLISLDMSSQTWTAANDKAVIFINKWDPTGNKAKSWKNYLEIECIDWLKQFLGYSRETLERKVHPKTSLFQKHSSSSEVVCHATGFFPRAVLVSWKKDGDELLEDVGLRETLPNEDGTFQKRSILKVSTEELQKHTYTCVIEHSSLEKDLVLPVSERPIPEAFTGKHFLKFLYTATIPGQIFPEFTAVGLVNGDPFIYYDSNIMKTIPKTQWIKNISDDDPHYWENESENKRNDYYTLRDNMDRIKQGFNHTAGVHTLQRMYGCECDDDDNTRGYDQYGYDGENFISLDLKTGTWTESKPQALIFIKTWDPEGSKAKSKKNFLENECIEWLKKFVSYGKETLEMKVRPEASLFQAEATSPEVVCDATGFFPKTLMISWQKNGQFIFEDVDLRETLPNQDGSFQKRSILKVSAEELQKHTYTCVIEHSSLEKDLVLPVSERRILRDGGSGGRLIGIIVGIIVALIVLVAVVAGIVVWKKKKNSDEADGLWCKVEERLSDIGSSHEVYHLSFRTD